MNRTILAAVDFSDTAHAVLSSAAILAKHLGSRILLAHVFDPPLLLDEGDTTVELEPGTPLLMFEEAARERITSFADDLARRFGVEVSTVIKPGDAAQVLDGMLRAEEPEMVVMGTHDGFQANVLGSTTHKIVHLSRVPILVVPPGDGLLRMPPMAKGILMATDFSAASERALADAIRLGQQFSTRVTVLHSLDRPSTYLYDPLLGAHGAFPAVRTEVRKAQIERLEQTAKRFREAGVPVSTEITRGAAASRIVQIARERNMGAIVLGTKGHTPIEHLLVGSVTNRILRGAPCPVWVRPPEMQP